MVLQALLYAYDTLPFQYYLVTGEVGTGKTRTLVEMVRAMIKGPGQQGEGAPIYVLASQGKSLPDTLAEAVNFLYDEHISLKFFLDFIFQVWMCIYSFSKCSVP